MTRNPAGHGRLNEPALHVLYVSAFLSAQTYARLLKHAAYPPSQATQKYSELLAKGLVASGARVTALTAPPIAPQSGDRRVIRLQNECDSGVDFCYLPVFNFPLVKHVVTWLAAFFQTLARCDEITHVLCYGLAVSACGGARFAAHLCGLPVTVIVSDMPEELDPGPLMRIAAKELRRYDGYILLTEAMNGRVNPHDKPFLVLEGQSDASLLTDASAPEAKDPDKVCLYAGMLHARYGILRLMEAFLLLNDPDARLALYGTGDALDEILRLAQTDGRIEYRGVVDNQTVVNAERRATLLINPRPTGEAFTKYSFPSKNIEYMASGTPVLTTRLPGMPAEYHPYVYLFDGETPGEMAKTLARVLALPKDALIKKGAAARTFVLTEKSNVRQAGRMLAFLKELPGRCTRS